MSYSIPSYIAAAAIDDPTLRYSWDDARCSDDFRYEAEWAVAAIAPSTLRAKIAVGIGIYEWIAWRFRSLSPDPLPFFVAEAVWCANVRRGYMEYFELEREDWLGPIRGPLWCAITWLLPMVFFSDDQPEEWQSGISYLSRLAVHVLPNSSGFEAWLPACIARMTTLYASEPADPFEDLFGEQEEERRGRLVPREALDPNRAYDPDDAQGLITQYLSTANFEKNPLLRPFGDF